MKKNAILLGAACLFTALTAFSQTSDGFNSRPGVSLDNVKGHLQGKCWTFSNFDVSSTGWNPAIEGDGTITSNNGATSSIYSPLLQVGGWIDISFTYTFNASFGASEERWIDIYLVNANHEIQSQLDHVVINSANAQQVYTYSKGLGAGSGLYKVLIQYGGSGTTRIGIDQVVISANQFYTNGCNMPPVAVNDAYTGNENRTATGNIYTNDFDPNGETFTAYVISGSPHGTVTINADNSFTFTPNPGFTGASTSFTYQICDAGFAPLCSNIATVTINFPTGGFLPVSLIDFTGLYRNNGNVEINWITTFESNSDRFEVERSLDGVKWTVAGTKPAQGVSTVNKSYSFIDAVGRNTANKNDLYYRLRMFDKDGKSAISKILVVRVYNSVNTKMISVTPNPAKNDIVATLQLNQASVVVLKVLTGTGVEVMRKTMKLSEGSNNILMDGTSKLTPGIYVLEVIVNNKERMLVKLVKE